MAEPKKILWLVSWYPNKYNPFDGDFVQRHARAAALQNLVHVLFVKEAFEQNAREELVQKTGNLTEQIIYLPKRRGQLQKLANHQRWKRQYKEAVERLLQKEKFALIHVHVPWKVGLIALWAKRRFNLPYLITEHWGIYNTVAEDNLQMRSVLMRRLLRTVFQNAAGFTSVSRYLGEGVNKFLLPKPFTVFPNAVDTSLFFPSAQKHSCFTFIHVSNMVPLKNVEGILHAFARVLQHGGAVAQLVLVGEPTREQVALANELGLLNTAVFFRGEVPYAVVAKEMQAAHVFVLNSNIENSPCVIGEALCCGLPVVATAVGGVPELVNETNGLLVPPQNTEALAAAMGEMMRNFSAYDAAHIARAANEKFSMEALGAQFSLLYTAASGA